MDPLIVMYSHFAAKFIMAPFRVIAKTVGRVSSLLSAETFLLWSFVVGYFQSDILASHLEFTSAMVCLMSSLCILCIEWALKYTRFYKLVDRGFIKDILGVLVYLSAPIVLIFYIWNPLYRKLPCIIRHTVTDSFSIIDCLIPAIWVVVAGSILGSAFYRLLKKKMKKSARAQAKLASLVGEVHTPVTRSMTINSRLRSSRNR